MKLVEFTRIYCAIMIVLFSITTILTGAYMLINPELFSLAIYIGSSIILLLLIYLRPTIYDVHSAYFPKNATIVGPSRLFQAEFPENSAKLLD